jgi:hypothetical protein
MRSDHRRGKRDGGKPAPRLDVRQSCQDEECGGDQQRIGGKLVDRQAEIGDDQQQSREAQRQSTPCDDPRTHPIRSPEPGAAGAATDMA